MKLYHVSQDENNDYDTFSDFVVCCESEEEARNTHPGNGVDPWNDRNSGWCKSPYGTEVKYIGEAANDIQKGIICSSFRAG